MNIPSISRALSAALCIVLSGCGSNSAPRTEPVTDARPVATSGAGATAKPKMTPLNAPGAQTNDKTFRVRGVAKGVEKALADGRMTLMVQHENIPGFMPAMEMRLPLASNADAAKIKAGDKIAFDLRRSNLEVSNLQILPPATPLKLKP